VAAEIGKGGGTAVAEEGGPAAHTLVVHPGLTEARLSERRDRLWSVYAVLAKPMRYTPVPPPAVARPALEALRAAMPNLREVIGRVLDELALQWATGARGPLRLPPMLLVGPPGIGKTRMARRLADALGLAFAWLGLGGSSDARELAGTARGWASTHPAWPVDRIVALGTPNPLLLLDEVEKVATTRHAGHAHDALLGMLERETARGYVDECVGGPVDLSHVSWVLTANSTGGLPAPLLSRVAVVSLPPPVPEDLPAILAAVLGDIASERGLADPRLLPDLGSEALQFIRATFAGRPDIRVLRRLVERRLAVVASEQLFGSGARRH
jgi:ATP-dependent Lon protease